jgi:hypothetical protein
VTIGSSVNVSGLSILNGNVTLGNSLTVSGLSILNGNVTIGSSLNVSGLTVFNNLPTISNTITPSSDLQLVTKAYVDTKSSSSTSTYNYDTSYNIVSNISTPRPSDDGSSTIFGAIYNITNKTIYIIRSKLTDYIISINTNTNIVTYLRPSCDQTVNQVKLSGFMSESSFAYNYNNNKIYFFQSSTSESPNNIRNALYYIYDITTNSLTQESFNTPNQYYGSLLALYSNTNFIYVLERYRSGSNSSSWQFITINLNNNSVSTNIIAIASSCNDTRTAVYVPTTNTFWCLPYNTTSFTVINISNNSCNTVRFTGGNQEGGRATYYSGFYSNNYIYLLGNGNDNIYKVNISNQSSIFIQSVTIISLTSLTSLINFANGFSSFILDNIAYIMPKESSKNICVYNTLNDNDESLTYSNLTIPIIPSTTQNFLYGGIVAIDKYDNVVIYGIPYSNSVTSGTQNFYTYFFNPYTCRKGVYSNYNIFHPYNNIYRSIV